MPKEGIVENFIQQSNRTNSMPEELPICKYCGELITPHNEINIDKDECIVCFYESIFFED